ncbi:Cystathionine beta-lyase MetC [Alphaproteobacteria bacterium SO-S41]|nr:Cystathionine beta-lyase MetC [Alphaproteobacteria bacterium SO-S41]
MKDRTRLIHSGRHPADHAGAVNIPVYRASTLIQPTVERLENTPTPFGYGRRGTPTTRGLEESVCALEGGARTMLTPSGLSACTAALMAVLGAGDHLLMVDTVYGPTRAFCRGPLKRFGVETTFYTSTITAADLEVLIRPNTKAIFLESPGSGTFEVQDVPALAATAKAHGIAVLVDNTWATPLLFKPLTHGADLSIVAATKYLVGHADVLIGTITANEATADKLNDFHGKFGLTTSGDDAYLTQRGMRTLGVRLAQHQTTALKLARWFQARPEVERVLYPALETDPGHAIWKRDFAGASGLFGVELKPASKTAVPAMLDGYELFAMGWSWGGYESLAVTTKIDRSAPGYRPAGTLLRFHAGLEDPDDLIADLAAGFERFNAAG